MKVFVNQVGDLAIGELILFHSQACFIYMLFNGHDRLYYTEHPHKGGWLCIGDL